MRPEELALVAADLPNLRRLAAAETADLAPLVVADGALPPVHVCARALAALAAGTSALWCVPFLVVVPARNAVVGGCTFKAAPKHRSVEVGYGVASSERGRGVATAAVARLLQLAADSGAVDEVVAHILPDNRASSRVVEHLGFVEGPSIVDADGERVVRWLRRIGP